jgi:gamma-glutamyltranspeptidase/glutathione hydrolase
MAWRNLVDPAIEIAEQGPVVDWHTTLLVATAMADLGRDPGARARFLPNGYPPLAPAAVEPDPIKRLPMPDLQGPCAPLARKGRRRSTRALLPEPSPTTSKIWAVYLSTGDLAAVRPTEVEPLTIRLS